MGIGPLDRRRLLAALTAATAGLAGCPEGESGGEEPESGGEEPESGARDGPTTSRTTARADTTAGETEQPGRTPTETRTPTPEAAFDVEGTPLGETVAIEDGIRVEVVVTNSGEADGETEVTLTADGEEIASDTVSVAAGRSETVELVADEVPGPGTVALAVNGASIGEVTVEQPVIHVDPDGDDDAVGTAADPVRTIETALRRAQPGQTVRLAPGEYRELVRTVRDGEPDAPITVTGPPEAVVRPTRAVNDCVLIEHHHFHIRGVTIDGLARPDERFEDYDAWMPRLVNISPRNRRDEGVEYVRGPVVEPSRLGNSARAMIQVERVRDAEIGGFEVIGPAGMQFDERVGNHEIGHIREIVYVGSPEIHRGESYYGYETLDRTRNVRIHHIDNSAGYRHNELVDVKLGSTNVTVEYCTTRNAGHNTESGVDAAIDVKGNDCTVRWNDIRASPLPFSFGAWAPSDDVDGGDWSRDNDVYGNVVRGFAAGPFRLRNEGDIGPVSFDDQGAICGNDIERGSPPLDPWVGDVNGYDGSAADRRGQDEVTVTVGAGDDQRAFDPPAVFVDPGTEVTWEWTGDDSHYVVQRGRVRDDADTVPDPRPAPYAESETFPEVGFYRYACYAHHETGMGGSVVVVSDEDRYGFVREACAEDVPSGDGVGHTGGD